MNNYIRTFLVYGDSGTGKSSFIKTLLPPGEEVPIVGGYGDSCTKEPGHIYRLKDDDLGEIQLIDTRGTIDTKVPDNQEIVNDLLRVLSDFSVLCMKKNLSIVQSLDGVIYVHSALQYSRYFREIRLAELGSKLGVNLKNSTLTIMTHGHAIQQLRNEQEKFNIMLEEKHSSAQEYVLWDSETPLPDQKVQLSQKLCGLKSFDLNNMKAQNQKILSLAKQMQINDQVPIQVNKFRTIEVIKEFTQMRIDTREKDITLTMECPFTQTYFSKLLQTITHSPVNTLTQKISVNFPPHSVAPRNLTSCCYKDCKFQNAEFCEEPKFIDKGAYYDANFKYRWKSIQDNNSMGIITLKLIIGIEYQEKIQVKTEQVEQYVEEEIQPRYPDEKPYLEKAQKQLLEELLTEQ